MRRQTRWFKSRETTGISTETDYFFDEIAIDHTCSSLLAENKFWTPNINNINIHDYSLGIIHHHI